MSTSLISHNPDLAALVQAGYKGTSNNCRFAATEACVTSPGLAGQRREMDRSEYHLRTLGRKTCNGRLRSLRFLLPRTALGTGAQRAGPIRKRVSTTR